MRGHLSTNMASLLEKKRQELHALVSQGKIAAALEFARALCQGEGKNDAQSWLLLGGVYSRCNEISEVKRCCRRALELDPNLAAAAFNLAVAEQVSGEFLLALDWYRRVGEINPGYPGLNANMGVCLRRSGDEQGAADCLRRALREQPANPEILYNLALSLTSTGALDEAVSVYRQAIALSPGDVRFHNNLGSVLFSMGETHAAIEACQRATRVAPDSFQAWYNLGIMCWFAGQVKEAYQASWKALMLEPDNLQARQSFVQLVPSVDAGSLSRPEYRELVRSLETRGVDVQKLALPCARIIKQRKDFSRIYRLAAGGDTSAVASGLSGGRFRSLLEDDLFNALLRYTVIPDEDFEILLTAMRRALISLSGKAGKGGSEALKTLLPFIESLAIQCFTNEFVFDVRPEETHLVDGLLDTISPLSLDKLDDAGVCVRLALCAMYRPLSELEWDAGEIPAAAPSAGSRIAALLRRQLFEPAEEAGIARGLRTIGAIEDETSRLVRAQYEENPYPRWVSVTVFRPRNVVEVLSRLFPGSNPADFAIEDPEILIAGCGTGSHAIMSASRFAKSRVLAIDLSMRSLSYARRQAGLLGVDNVDFVHADILCLDRLEQTFDIVESVGVLHHMRDPEAGMRMLVSKLKPGGLMNIGLYSSIARRHVIQVRDFVSARRCGSDAESIRAFRQTLFAFEKENPLRRVCELQDFYSLSECRDLLFHVQEHCYTLPDIARMLDSCGLEFIGFEFTDPGVRRLYQQRFPDDVSLGNLENWDHFEREFPDTFIGMYNFWCRKRAD